MAKSQRPCHWTNSSQSSNPKKSSGWPRASNIAPPPLSGPCSTSDSDSGATVKSLVDGSSYLDPIFRISVNSSSTYIISLNFVDFSFVSIYLFMLFFFSRVRVLTRNFIRFCSLGGEFFVCLIRKRRKVIEKERDFWALSCFRLFWFNKDLRSLRNWFMW